MNKRTMRINLLQKRNKIPVGRTQEDNVFPKLLTTVIENTLQTLNWEERGIKIKRELLHHLGFVDDITVFANTKE